MFEGSPNFPWFNVMNIGLERPIKLEAGRNYHLQLIVDDTIGTLYVDGVALNVRMYERPGESLSIFATDASLRYAMSPCSRIEGGLTNLISF